MNQKTKFQLNPQQQEIWEENIPHLLSISRTIRILQGVMIVLFCFSAYRGKTNSFWQIFAFCAALLLSVLFSELYRNNLRKNRSPYLPSLYILGIICCIGSPILNIVNRLPDSLDWDIYTALSLIFGVLSIILSIYFLVAYPQKKPAAKIINVVIRIIAFWAILIIIPIAFLDVYHSFILLPIITVNIMELALTVTRYGKIKRKNKS